MRSATQAASYRVLVVSALMVLVALATGCALVRGERSVGVALGSTSGDGPDGVVIGPAVQTLADQVESGGARRPGNPGLATQLRAVDTSAAFVYGYRYNACTESDPELVAQRRRAVEAHTDDLNRECYQAEPVTVYFVVDWDDLADTFTISSGDEVPGTTRVQDRRVV
jgi:hypothetical protein